MVSMTGCSRSHLEQKGQEKKGHGQEKKGQEQEADDTWRVSRGGKKAIPKQNRPSVITSNIYTSLN
jgi:hypothetical protein